MPEAGRQRTFFTSKYKFSCKCLLSSVSGRLKCRCLSGVGISHKASRPGGMPPQPNPSAVFLRKREILLVPAPSPSLLSCPLSCSRRCLGYSESCLGGHVGVHTLAWLSLEARGVGSPQARGEVVNLYVGVGILSLYVLSRPSVEPLILLVCTITPGRVFISFFFFSPDWVTSDKVTQG